MWRLKVGLDRIVEFKAKLQARGRLQIPKNIRWQFKLETTQTLRVTVNFDGYWNTHQEFYGQMTSEGRILIPKLEGSLLQASFGEQAMTGAVVNVELRPADYQSE